jgi:membrane associated rhomboid family serine protease
MIKTVTEEDKHYFLHLETPFQRADAAAETAYQAALNAGFTLNMVSEPHSIMFGIETPDQTPINLMLYADKAHDIEALVWREGKPPYNHEINAHYAREYEAYFRAELSANCHEEELEQRWLERLQNEFGFVQKKGEWVKKKDGIFSMFQGMLRGETGSMTFMLIALNVLVYLLFVVGGAGFFTLDHTALLSMGGNYTAAIQQGEWWRLLSACFLHGGIIHLLLNMYGLFMGGMMVEFAMGRWKFLTAYLVSGIAGSAVSYYFHDEVLSVGASGAVFGVFGMALGMLSVPAGENKDRLKMLGNLALYMVISLIYGMKEGIDNWAHGGGLVAGYLIGLVYSLGGKFIPEAPANRSLVYSISAVVLLGASYLVYAKPHTLRLYIEHINRADEWYQKALRNYPEPTREVDTVRLRDSGILAWNQAIYWLEQARNLEGLDSSRQYLSQRFIDAAIQRRMAYRYLYRAVTENSNLYFDSIRHANEMADSLEMRN